MKTEIDRNLLCEILKTTEEMKVLRKKIRENAEDLSEKLAKEIHELEQVPNPSPKLQSCYLGVSQRQEMQDQLNPSCYTQDNLPKLRENSQSFHNPGK